MWTRIETVSAIAAGLGIALAVTGGPGASISSAPHGTGAMDVSHADVSFADDVMPMLEARCVSCHGAEDDEGVRLEAGLNLTSYDHVMGGSEFGTVVEAGDPDGSMIVVLIEDGDMPEDGDPVTPEELEKLRTWIAEGAKNN